MTGVLAIDARLGALLRPRWSGEASAWAAGLVVAWLLFDHFPGLLWMAPVCAVVAYVFRIFRKSSFPHERKWLVGICLLAALVSSLVVASCGTHNPETFRYSLDDATYLKQATAIAAAWREGLYPAVEAKGSAPYFVGSLHTGYQRLLAAVFYCAGPDYRWGIGLNLLGVVLLPIFVFRATTLLARELVGGEERFAHRLGMAAAGFVAVYPSLGYWASWLLKDVLLALVFTAALAALLDYAHRPRAEFIFYFSAMLAAVASLRAYAALGLALGAFVYVLSLLPRSVSAWLAGLVGFGLALFGYTEKGEAYINQLVYSLAQQLPDQARTVERSISYVATSVPRLLLSPYAWVRARGANPMYELYPGMWLLYLVIYPLAAKGFVELARGNVQSAAIPVVAWASGAIVLVLAYAGDAPRQRLYLDILLFVIAGCGLKDKIPWRAFVLWYSALALFALVQLVTLTQRS